MNSRKTPLPSLAYGHAPQEWEKRLSSDLNSADYRSLEETLLDLRKELNEEVDSLRTLENGPLLSQLTEQARRLFQITPTRAEALQSELIQERTIWSDYRERYRNTVVPASLHPFLKSCSLFLRPSTADPQFPDFAKYFGHSPFSSAGTSLEAVTLFSPEPDKATNPSPPITPPNFFSEFDRARGCFTVKRAYRTALPKGAGAACILEQLSHLVPQKDDLRCLMFDNVKNSVTYDIFVEKRDGTLVLRSDPDHAQAPLVKLAKVLLAALGLTPLSVTPRLDRFGFLDILIPVG